MTRARTNADQAHTESVESIPHIIPGVLYPAVAGKDLSGTALGGSYTYGTAHTDGRSYYYTDIKGSKPIKDPRIGAHFGSQRHAFRSMQLQEQETATHGLNVYKMDGREWMRVVGGSWNFQNGDQGVELVTANSNPADFIEITGYFSHCNFLIFPQTNSANDVNIYIDGTDTGNDFSTRTTSASPLGTRYVNGNMLVNLNLGSTTLGLHTLKIGLSSTYMYLTGCELIAQDTTSTANKSKIQIPSQNVVSYGKKFTVSGTPHYDPFNGFVNDTTLFSSVVDVETSLGLGTATTWGAPWDKGSDDNIRPFNGGRVVKWVDSSGNIKTSVTMMPANAQNIGTTASNEITTASATNSHTINFSDDAIDNSLSEVAKTFHYGEFGNGSANYNATWKDPSTATISDGQNLAYVMDDGLTGLSGQSIYSEPHGGKRTLIPYNDADFYYVTFIGTGVSIEVTGGYGTGIYNLAQNLPYGTHILKVYRTSIDPTYTIDGVSVGQIDNDTYGGVTYISFHQPKMPPIPEDAVVLADYMLMADFVAQSSDGIQHLSKGTRMVNSSRDFFYDRSTGSFTLGVNVSAVGGIDIYSASHASCTNRLTAFGSNVVQRGYALADRYQSFYVNDTSHSGSAVTTTKTGTGWGSFLYPSSATTLGNNVFEAFNVTANGSNAEFSAFEVVTPIHTSSHYQTFETPYLHELVGGDRNMEQHNLIVTPDGKSWDEVTRDTSYISNVKLRTNLANSQSIGYHIFTEWRGQASAGDIDGVDKFNKDFAIAYDRIICLKDGNYQITWWVYINMDDSAGGYDIRQNGTIITQNYSAVPASAKTNSLTIVVTPLIKRGDYIQFQGTSAISQQNFEIIRV